MLQVFIVLFAGLKAADLNFNIAGNFSQGLAVILVDGSIIVGDGGDGAFGYQTPEDWNTFNRFIPILLILVLN